MTLMIQPDPEWSTNELLANVLVLCKAGQRVQFLVDPRAPDKIIQRLRVALSRSRNRRRQQKLPISEFTLRGESYPYTQGGKRYACIVMWIEKDVHHVHRELLDDLIERNQIHVTG